VPAVLSEAVANGWDADATKVQVTIDLKKDRVQIDDDGEGMSLDDVNQRYLRVGHQRREEGYATTTSGRAVMGRKGIGKLSLFSIADKVEIHTRKGDQTNAFLLNRKDIEKAIKDREEDYTPPAVSFQGPSTDGTRIILTKLSKRMSSATGDFLRRRLARRFSSAKSPGKPFEIVIDSKTVSPGDRGYYDKVQFLWTYGVKGDEYENLCTKAKKKEKRNAYLDRTRWKVGSERSSIQSIFAKIKAKASTI
jgi:hypothetical protein